jgi:hypothetical protein
MIEIDRLALELAMRMARHPAERAEQLDAMLKDRPWLEVAMFAAQSCQTQNLNLRPWEIAPCEVDDPNDYSTRVHPHLEYKLWYSAAKLQRLMRQYGVSKWHPDPLLAIERAKAGR